MSKTVDERVVQMSFDNRNFERNTKQTMNTIAKLKNSLDFNGAVRSLDQLDKSAKNVNFSGLTDSLETVRLKISALEAAGFETVRRLTNAAIDAGKSITRALTIEFKDDGFREYELEMESVQTIMNSTGETLETVNGYLAELNTYSDKTIYSFSDMTSSIGKFTNNGVKLEDAVKAIQGISNEAALAGANSNQASHAMYNFAQALASGSVKLIDWKSIENANMATVEFKNELIKTATELHTLIEVEGEYKSVTTDASGKTSDWFNSTKAFNDSLSANWMTTEVLTKTLAKYSDETTELGQRAFAAAQDVKTFTQLMDTLKEALGSGWAQTWKLIIGNFDEAKEVFTKASNFFSDIISEQSDLRNSLVKKAMQNVVDESSWNELKEAGVATKEFKKSIIEVAESHGEAVKSMINDEGSFVDSLKRSWLSSDYFKEALDKTQKDIKVKAPKIKKALQKAFSKDKTTFGRGIMDQMVNYTKVGQIITNVYEKAGKSINDYSDASLEAAGITSDQVEIIKELERSVKNANTPLGEMNEKLNVKSGRDTIIDAMFTLLEALKKVTDVAMNAWNKIIPATSAEKFRETIDTVVGSIDRFVTNMVNDEHNLENLRKTLEGLFSIFEIGRQIITIGWRSIGNVVDSVLGAFGLNILDVTAGIGSLLTRFNEWLKTDNFLVRSLTAVGDKLGAVIKYVVEFVKAFSQLPWVQNVFKALTEASKMCGNALYDFFDNLGPNFSNFIAKVKDLKTYSEALTNFLAGAQGVWEKIKSTFKKWLEYWGIYADTTEKLYGDSESIRTKILNGLGAFGETLVGIFEWVKDKVANMNIAHVISLALGVGIFKVINIIQSLSGAIAGFFKSLTGVITSIKAIQLDLSKVFNAAKLRLQASALLTYAEALIVMAGALYILAQIPTNDLIKAGIAMAGLLIALGVFAKAVQEISISPNAAKNMLGFIPVAAALLIVVKAMIALDSIIASETFGGTYLALASIMGMLTLMCYVASKYEGSFKNTIFIQMAAAVMSFAITCRMLGNMSVGELAQAVITLAALTGIMTAVVAMSRLAGNNANEAGSLLMKFGVALITIGVACRIIGNTDSSSLTKAIEVITAITIAMGVLVICSRAARYSTERAGKLIFKMSAGLLLIGVACRIIGRMDTGSIAKAIVTVEILMASFGGLMIFAGKLEKGQYADKVGSLIMKMASAIGIISVSIGLLGILDLASLAKGVIAIDSILACFALIVGMSGKMARNDKAVNMITRITVGIAAMVGCLTILAMFDTEQIVAATTALDSMLLSMGAFMKLSTGAQTSDYNAAILLGVVALVTGIVWMFANIDPSKSKAMEEIAVGMSAMLISLGGAAKLLNGINLDTTSTLKTLGLMGIAMVEVGAILAIMSTMKLDVPIQTALSLSVFLLAMSACIPILSKAGTTSKMAVKAAVALDAVIGLIGGLVLAVGGLFTNIEALDVFLDKGIDVLVRLGEGLGEIVGAIIGGIGSGISMSLPIIGDNISAFWSKISTFINEVPSVSEDVFAATARLVLMLSLLTASSFLDGLTSIFGGGHKNMNNFATGIATFGDAIIAFGKSIKSEGSEIDLDSVKKASAAGLLLAAMCAELPSDGSWLTKIVLGDKMTMETFAQNIKDFGKAIKKFAKSIKGIDFTAAESAATVGKTLASLEENLPKHGGKLQEWVGDDTLAAFGVRLATFGAGLKIFVEKTKKIDSTAGDAASNIGTLMSELENGLVALGGVKQYFTGEDNLGDFGFRLVSFSLRLGMFVDNIKTMDDDAKKSAETAKIIGNLMSTLESGLPQHYGVLQAYAGDDTLSSFGVRLATFGAALKIFVEKTNGIDQDAADSAEHIGTILCTLEESLGENNSFWEQLTGTGAKTLIDFGEEIKSFGYYLKGFSGYVTDLDESKFTAIVDAVSVLASVATNQDALDADSLYDGLKAFAKVGIDGFADEFTSTDAACAVSHGVEGFKRIFLTAVKWYHGKFKMAGQNAVQGFLDGVDDKIQSNRITELGSAIGDLLITAAEKALDEHSPSKEMYRVGRFAVEGFLNAIEDGSAKVKTVAHKIFKGFVEEATALGNTVKYTTGSITSFAKLYGDTSSIANYTKSKDAAAVATNKFVLALYKQSDAYAEDKAAMKENASELKSLYAKRDKLAKQYKKQVAQDLADEKAKRAKLVKQLNQSIKQDKKDAKEKNAKNKSSNPERDAAYEKMKADLGDVATVAEQTVDGVTDKVKEGVGKIYDGIEETMPEIKELLNVSDEEAEEVAKNCDTIAEHERQKNEAALQANKEISESEKKADDITSERTKNLRKQLKEFDKEAGAVTSSQKSIRKQYRQTEKEIKKQRKVIDEYRKTMAKHAKEVFEAYRNSIKETIEAYTNLFTVTLLSTSRVFNVVDKKTKAIKEAMKSVRKELKDALKTYMKLSSVAMDTGISLFDEFNANGEETQRTQALTQATEALTDAKKELAEANAEEEYAESKLAKAQEKSNAVHGRSQKFLKDIEEAEKELAEAKSAVAEKSAAEAKAQEAVNEANKDTRTEDTLKNMKSQIEGVKTIRENLQLLAEKGIDEGLLKSLKNLGTSGADQIATFVRMSQNELAKANELFKESAGLSATALMDGFKEKISDVQSWGENFEALSKLNIADEVKQALMTEFREQGVESNEYIKAILTMSDSELKELEDSYREYMSVPGKIAKEIAKYNKETIAEETAEEDTSVKDMLDNMQANIKNYDTWKSELAKLQKKTNKGIIDADLMTYLRNLGEEGADTVATFAKMTTDELKKASELFREAGKQTSQSLIDGMGGKLADVKSWQDNIKQLSTMDLPKKVKEAIFNEAIEKGIDSAEYIESIVNMDPAQREEFVSKYQDYLNVQEDVTDNLIASGAYICNLVEDSMVNTMTSVAGVIGKYGVDNGKTAMNSIVEGLKSILGDKLPNVTATAKQFSKTVMEAIAYKLSKSSGKVIGSNLVQGLINGLNNTESLVNAVANVGAVAMNALKKKLGIHSPSKEFEKLGMYTNEGFAEGLSNNTNIVLDATENVGSSAIKIMSDSIAKIADMIDEDMDTEPTIRPVLDMSDVENGLQKMDGVFDGKSIGFNSSSLAAGIARGISNTQIQNANNSSYDYSQQNKFENTFHITGDNPKEIANEVSIILQRQLERRGAVWA